MSETQPILGVSGYEAIGEKENLYSHPRKSRLDYIKNFLNEIFSYEKLSFRANSKQFPILLACCQAVLLLLFGIFVRYNGGQSFECPYFT